MGLGIENSVNAYNQNYRYQQNKTTGQANHLDFNKILSAKEGDNTEKVQKPNENSVSKVDTYTEYLKAKYGNIMIQNVGSDQKSMDSLGTGTYGMNNIVIAPNVLETMANDPKKAAYYEKMIQDFFASQSTVKAQMAVGGFEIQSYITSGDTATYYLYVLASEGGSVSESFTLDYSVSTACDSYEIDESVRQALAFTYGAGGAYIESRNLSSPIDNDWYVITVPSSRIYDKLKISATTASTNTCSVEVYQNVASEGYQMKRVGSGNTISVSSGKYYIRVSNAKTMENFDDLDIQNYKLSITPILKATGIVITDLKGSEGLNKVVNYPGYGAHFRTQGSGTLTVYGVLTATDSSTGVTYAVGGEQINGLYYSPAWEANNTSANAIRRGTGTTDSSGKFEIDISLPPGIGVYSYYGSTSTHYFDICGVSVSPSDDSSISASETIFHLAYTMYHPF